MKKIIGLGVLLALGLSAYIFGKPYYDLHYAEIELTAESTELYIPTGTELDGLGTLIESQNILDKETFRDYSEKLEFDDANIESGKYLVKKGQTIKSLIYGLKDGNQEIKDVRLTFNNCKSVEEMAGKVAPMIEADSASIVDYALAPTTIDHYGFNDETIISMYLPDTYEIGEWDITAEEFVSFMADQYKSFWDDEGSGRGSKLAALGMEQSEVSTLATIVMAEQGKFDQEWETIAGLYLNRLEQGIKLQSDPTAKFCWGDELDGVQRILYEHLKKDCPYNTYIYTGLPPGPLWMPTKKAIDAVLNAEDHDYIFMCARADNSGLHNFAATLAQHNKNAAAFRKWMDQQGL